MFASKDLFLTPPSAGGYTIARSVRLRSSASGYFNRTLTTPTSATIWTWSVWVKRGALTGTYRLFGASTTTFLTFNSSDQLNLTLNGVSAATSTAVFRDPSAWYHIVYQQNGSAQTIYVNSVSIATGTTAASIFNTAISHQIGAANTTNYFDGYLTEINFIDGQALTPSSFGSTNAITGVWQPAKYTGTYGTNGFYLNFSDNSSNTATTIGKDYSGNGNNWTPNNISVTAGSTYDSMTDVPTLTSATVANFAVLNPLDLGTTITIQDGNLTGTIGTTHNGVRGSMQFPTSGKWYWEVSLLTTTSSSNIISFGLATSAASMNTYDYNTTGTYSLYLSADRQFIVNGSGTSNFGSATAAGTVCGIAYDAGNGQLYLAIGNTYYKSDGTGTGNPSGGTNSSMAVSASLGLFPYVHLYGNTGYANFGQRPFTYTPPTGYVALNTYNLPTSTITNGAAYMAATTYTGNGSTTGNTQSISNAVNGVSFQPDLVWVKSRSAATFNILVDSVRGTNTTIYSNGTNAEESLSNVMNSFNSGGFTAAYNSAYGNVVTNANAVTYVGWQWKAGTTSSSNTNGSITSTVSVGATQGFSVVTYTGTGANATVGHGLGVAPSMIIIKKRSAVGAWVIGFTYSGFTWSTDYFQFDTSAKHTDGAGTVFTAAPTSTVFSLGTDAGENGSGATFVAYCFAPVAGYSAFGSFSGNGSADGPFVYTGFRPRFVMIKRTDSSPYNWVIGDTSRNTYNIATAQLSANLSDAENTSYMAIDFVSNGFKLRTTDGAYNASGGTYVYACFAENPFKNSLAR